DYERQYICAKDIFEVVKLFTEKFQSESDFTQWCKGKVNYIQMSFSRKRNQSGSAHRVRELYILKPKFYSS
ncbi:hypothetical protein HMPREF1544_03397, partial [Mucor circinelloides 1006PhL]